MQTKTYVVNKDLTDRDEATFLCDAVLDALRPHAVGATVDAYSDFGDVLPFEVREALQEVHRRGRTQDGRDSGYGVDLDLSEPRARRVLRLVAPWSINVDLWGTNRHLLATFHDCGHSVSFDMTEAEAATMADHLRGIAPVLPLSEAQARLKADRTGARKRRLVALRRRILDALRR